jgi:hypothetical protein
VVHAIDGERRVPSEKEGDVLVADAPELLELIRFKRLTFHDAFNEVCTEPAIPQRRRSVSLRPRRPIRAPNQERRHKQVRRTHRSISDPARGAIATSTSVGPVRASRLALVGGADGVCRAKRTSQVFSPSARTCIGMDDGDGAVHELERARSIL